MEKGGGEDGDSALGSSMSMGEAEEDVVTFPFVVMVGRVVAGLSDRAKSSV